MAIVYEYVCVLLLIYANKFDSIRLPQELSKMSVSDLVAKRTEIQKQILINPADVEAHKALNYIQQQV